LSMVGSSVAYKNKAWTHLQLWRYTYW
jgi:hypothetical protein